MSGVVSTGPVGAVAALPEPEPARSIAVTAPVSLGFFFSHALPISSGAHSKARTKCPETRVFGTRAL